MSGCLAPPRQPTGQHWARKAHSRLFWKIYANIPWWLIWFETGDDHDWLSVEKITKLDALYAERSASGQPTAWGLLVERLRELRRAIEAGEVVQIAGGPTLRSVLDFHTWAYERYKLLEEGYDSWIGDDAS